MAVKTQEVGPEELRGRLDHLEREFNLPSERFIEAFRNGELQETEAFRIWSHTYGAWKLRTKPR